jgi:hypothetical protein
LPGCSAAEPSTFNFQLSTFNLQPSAQPDPFLAFLLAGDG